MSAPRDPLRDWEGIYQCETCHESYTSGDARARSFCCTKPQHVRGDHVRLLPYDRRKASRRAPVDASKEKQEAFVAGVVWAITTRNPEIADTEAEASRRYPAQPEGDGWISVKDRLPERSGEYEVCWEHFVPKPVHEPMPLGWNGEWDRDLHPTHWRPRSPAPATKETRYKCTDKLCGVVRAKPEPHEHGHYAGCTCYHEMRPVVPESPAGGTG